MVKPNKRFFIHVAILFLAYFSAWFLCCGILFAQGQYDSMDSVLLFRKQFSNNLGIQVTFFAVFLLSVFTYRSFFRQAEGPHLSCILPGLLFAGIFILGLCQQCSDSAFFLIPGTGIVFRLGMLFSIGLLFCCAIEIMNRRLDEIAGSLKGCQREVRLSTRSLCITALVLLLSWLPYFLFSYPGAVCYDARIQLEQFWGVRPFSNNNPIFDTFVYGILFRIGELLGRSDNAGIAFNLIVQLLLFSFSFAYCAETVCLLTRSRAVEGALVFFYAVIPLYGGAVQIVLKDSLHLAFAMWYFSLLVRMLYLPVTKRTLLLFSVAFLLAAFTRKAALLYVIAGAITLLVLVRKKPFARKLFISILLCVGCFLLTENAVFPLLGVEKAPNRELLAFPIQSVSYITKQHHQELPGETLEKIDEMIGVEAILKEFNPNLADPMKFRFQGDEKELLSLLFSMIKQYPLDFIKSILTVSWKYASPYSVGNAYFRSYMDDFSHLGREIYFVWPELHQSMIRYVNSWAHSPILTLLIGPGLYCWFFLFAAARAWRNQVKEALVILVPLGVLLAGLLFTPVNGEVRYAYPLIGLAPAALAWVCSLPPAGKKVSVDPSP